MNPALTIRPESPADIDAIHDVTVAAFATLEVSGQTEQFIVAALRAAKALAVSLVAISGIALADLHLTAAQAKSHVGENAKVCGTVVSAKYAVGSKGMPTFLNLDKPYPDHIFTAVIWGASRPSFRTPPESLVGSFICVSGFITSYRNRPEIIVNDPTQIGR